VLLAGDNPLGMPGFNNNKYNKNKNKASFAKFDGACNE
jgi:hypothetical protein